MDLGYTDKEETATAYFHLVPHLYSLCLVCMQLIFTTHILTGPHLTSTTYVNRVPDTYTADSFQTLPPFITYFQSV